MDEKVRKKIDDILTRFSYTYSGAYISDEQVELAIDRDKAINEILQLNVERVKEIIIENAKKIHDGYRSLTREEFEVACRELANAIVKE